MVGKPEVIQKRSSANSLADILDTDFQPE